MYTIKAYYKKWFKIHTIKKLYDTDSYEEAMEMFDGFLREKKISEENIINYSVVKKIVCNHCNETIDLIRSVNKCTCGTEYDNFGNEIVDVK